MANEKRIYVGAYLEVINNQEYAFDVVDAKIVSL